MITHATNTQSEHSFVAFIDVFCFTSLFSVWKETETEGKHNKSTDLDQSEDSIGLKTNPRHQINPLFFVCQEFKEITSHTALSFSWYSCIVGPMKHFVWSTLIDIMQMLFDPDLNKSPNTIKNINSLYFYVLNNEKLLKFNRYTLVSEPYEAYFNGISLPGRLNLCFLSFLFFLSVSMFSRSSWSKRQEGNGVSRSCTRKPKTAPV